jgi:hypothetical protein
MGGNALVLSTTKQGFIVFDDSLNFFEEIPLWIQDVPYRASLFLTVFLPPTSLILMNTTEIVLPFSEVLFFSLMERKTMTQYCGRIPQK